MIRINLLPRGEINKENTRKSISIGVLSLILLIVILGGFHIRMSMKVQRLQSEIKNTEAEIKRITKIVGDVKKFEKEKKDLQEKIKVISILSRKKTGPVHMLDELSTNTPGKLWVTSLKESNLNLDLMGIALDNETIATFMLNMEKSPNFSNIELIQAQQYIEKGLKLEKFDIKCRVLLPEKE